MIESISPVPLTACIFDELWQSIGSRLPVTLGVIPSPLLGERAPETELDAFVDHVLETVGDTLSILDINDTVLGTNLIDRLEGIAGRIEEHVI